MFILFDDGIYPEYFSDFTGLQRKQFAALKGCIQVGMIRSMLFRKISGTSI
jgi:hypothetical protein